MTPRSYTPRTIVAGTVVAMLASVVATPTPATARQPTWSGPNDVTMVGLVSADDALLVAAGRKSFLIWREQDYSGDRAPTRLVGTRVTDGGPTEMSYAAPGTRIQSLQAPARGSTSGVTVAWYASRLVGGDSGATYLSTAEFDGDSWSVPTVHFEAASFIGSYTRASGYAVAQDAAGNVTLVWREIADDYSTGQLRMSYSMLARSRLAGGDWGEPVVIQAFPQFADGERKEFTSSGPRITSMSDGRLLLCSSSVRQAISSVTPTEEIQCWTSPSAGAAWSALPAVPTTTSVWQPVLLGDGVPMIVMTGWSLPVTTIYRRGSWTATARIAPDPPTQRPAPITGGGFVLAEDGVGGVHVVQFVGDRAMRDGFETAYLSSIYVASNSGDGWSTWRRVSGVFQPPFNESILSPKASALPGSLLVTWVQGQHYDAYTQADRGLFGAWMIGGSWSAPQRIGEFDPVLHPYDKTNPYHSSETLLSPSGHATVAWTASSESPNPWRIWGARIPATVPSVTPGMPTGLTAQAARGSVTLSWSPPTRGGDSVTSYQWRSQRAGKAWSPWKTLDRGSQARRHVLDGLRPGTRYVFQVRAVSGRNTGPPASVRVTGR